MADDNNITDQFADLLEDYSAGRPQSDAEEQPAEEAKGSEGVDTSPEPPADNKADRVAEPQKQSVQDPEIEIGGKKYKLSELNELVRNAETWRNQLPHYQRLYEQEKQRAEQLESIYRQQMERPEQEQSQQQPIPQGPLTEDKLIEIYEPRIQAMIKDGIISEDLYTEHPALVAHFVHFQETQFKPIVEFIEKYAVPAIQYITNIAQQQRQLTISQVSERLASILEEMSKEPDAAELADENVAAQFVVELASRYNDPAALTDPNIVRQEWVRRNWSKYRQMVLEAAKSGGNGNGHKAMASAGSAGVRPAATVAQPKEETWFDDLLQEKQMPTR